MIFIDTGAWIALTDKSDQYHHEAVQIYSKLKNKRKRFVTTDYIIDEAVTRLRYDTNHQIAVKFLELINISEKTGTLRVTYVNEKLFQKAVSIFRQYDSAVLSFTYCVSFAICKMHKIDEAFAFDQHFTMLGISLSKG
jgi:predicted nucleic acid-binding protein